MADTQESEILSNRATLAPANKNDGSITVTFSDNDLEAKADFFPPTGRGALISGYYMDALLERLNIVHGVRDAALREAVEQCNRERRPLRGVLIARGEPSVDEALEYFELNPHIKEPPRPPEDDQRIDHRAYSPFIIVKQDQILASLHPRKTGKDGINVHSQVIPMKVIRPVGVTGGANTRTDEKAIYAAINGQLVQKGSQISVQDSLVIKGPVGYSTGNIIFPGDVIIDGPVSDGFKIVSGGSVLIKQTFDVTNVITKGDLSVEGGIIGRGQALVKVGGALRTKFIENCRAACRKTVSVNTEVVNSSIYTMENLDLGDKGILLGSEVYAIQGIRAGSIGKRSGGKSTQIHCGVDFTVQQEKEKRGGELRILTAKQEKVRELLSKPESNAGARAKMEELLRRLEEEQKKISARIIELQGKSSDNRNATVEVTGEVCPGTLIEICQVALFVTEPLRRVRIKLDAQIGKLVSTPL